MSNRIREIREAQGLTLDRLAERMGMSGAQISRLETDKRRLTVDHLVKFAAALHVPVSALLCRERDDGRIGAAPATPQFVDDVDELAWLSLWRSMDRISRRILLAALLAERPNDDAGPSASSASDI